MEKPQSLLILVQVWPSMRDTCTQVFAACSECTDDALCSACMPSGTFFFFFLKYLKSRLRHLAVHWWRQVCQWIWRLRCHGEFVSQCVHYFLQFLPIEEKFQVRGVHARQMNPILKCRTTYSEPVLVSHLLLRNQPL